jgi:hypothetical protein
LAFAVAAARSAGSARVFIPTDRTEPARSGTGHYRKQSLHRELEASARAKSAALGEAPLRRERKVWLSAKDWPTVISTFAESFLSSALGEGFG